MKKYSASEVFKQLGKALCYLLVFVGMQFMVTFVIMFGYIFLEAFRAAASGGGEAAVQTVVEGSVTFIFSMEPWITIVSNGLCLLTLWIVFLIRRKKTLLEVHAVPFAKSQIFPVILAALGAYLLIGYGMEILPIPEEAMEAYAEASKGLTQGSVWLLFLSNVIAAPVAEEVVFRGLIFTRLKKAMPVWVAGLVSTLCFGLLHGQLIWICYATLLGLFFCYVSYKTDSILSSICMHMIFNFLGSMPFMTGWELPMAVCVALTVLGAVAIVVSILLIRRNADACKAVPADNR